MLTALALFLTIAGTTAQNTDFPDSILLAPEGVPKVLLVGTFHFGYPNLDAHKVSKEDQIDILSETKQVELLELVGYLARFRPTKVVVEAGRNTGYLLRRYDRWQNEGEPLRPQEIDQIAFRLMRQFALDTLYGCDAAGVDYDMANTADSIAFRKYLDGVFEGYDWISDDATSLRYKKMYDEDNKLSVRMKLLDYFKLSNSEQAIRRAYGAYLCGDFKLGDFNGADALALYWYSRNLRIFRNIQRIEAKPDDRILVLFGSGHIGILHQLFECSPEYELVKFTAL